MVDLSSTGDEGKDVLRHKFGGMKAKLGEMFTEARGVDRAS